MDWHDLSKFCSDIKWLMAGCFGSLAASFFHREELESKRDFFLFFMSGWACAYFLTGVVAQYFKIEQENIGAVGFLLGAFGGSLIAAVIRSLQNADVWELIRQRFGGGE